MTVPLRSAAKSSGNILNSLITLRKLLPSKDGLKFESDLPSQTVHCFQTVRSVPNIVA